MKDEMCLTFVGTPGTKKLGGRLGHSSSKFIILYIYIIYICMNQ
jgi:hypothetical protein